MEILKRLSPNITVGDYPKSLLVLHSTLGSEKGAIGWLCNKASNVSAHFVIGRSGRITQLVELQNCAWHAGRISNPSDRAKVVLRKKGDEYINPNLYTIGIEFAAGFDEDHDGEIEQSEFATTDEQITSSLWLIRKLEEWRYLEVTEKNIITHRDITSYKPEMEACRNEILKRLNSNQVNMITYKKKNEPDIYIAVGTKLIPFATDWKTYQSDFKNAVIVELSHKEFKNFTIAKNVNITSKS